jgi:sec-independent protein translocase protein TatC
MKIYKYYLEIKYRILMLLLTWFSVVLVSYCFKELLLFLIIKPNELKYSLFYFIFTDVKEVFSVYITLVLFIGNQFLVYYFLYHLLIFIALGLYKFEYRYLIFIFKTSMFFFFFSVFIYNKLLFPLSWEFFLSFQNFILLKSFILHFEAKLSEYLTFYITFYYICIFYFQTFMVLVLFFDYIRNELEIIKNFRKIFYYSFVIFSTLITPPDVLSQFILSLIIIFSYEMLIFYIIIKKVIKNNFN